LASEERNGSEPIRSQPIRTLARVGENQCEGGTNYRIVLEVDDWPEWGAGQFVMLSPGPETAAVHYDPLLPRPMAIFASSGSTGSQKVVVLYKVEGRGTQLLAAARVGDHVRIVGPLGRGFEIPEKGTHSILVGGGTGTASLYGLASAALAAGPVTVILGARRAELLMAPSDFEKLGVELKIATEDGSSGSRGLVTDVLKPMLEATPDTGSQTRVYACGPTPMMRACSELAKASGTRCDVALENRMACGFGVCLGCAVPMAEGGYTLVCNQGPVYDSRDLEWAGIP